MMILTARSLSGLTVLALAAFLAPGLGCGGWTQAHRDNAMEEFRGTTLESAAFALDCEVSAVTVKLTPEGEPFPDRALVSGCGNKATYVKARAGWVMESGPGR